MIKKSVSPRYYEEAGNQYVELNVDSETICTYTLEEWHSMADDQDMWALLESLGHDLDELEDEIEFDPFTPRATES